MSQERSLSFNRTRDGRRILAGHAGPSNDPLAVPAAEDGDEVMNRKTIRQLVFLVLIYACIVVGAFAGVAFYAAGGMK